MKLSRHSLLVAGVFLLGVLSLTSCKKEYSDDSPITLQPAASVYIGNNNNFVYALDPETGAKRWELNAGSPVLAGVVIHDNAAFISSSAGILYKVDRATGKVLMQRDFQAPILVTPLTYNNILYVAAGSTLHYLNNADLTSIHTANASGNITGAPTIAPILGFEHRYVFVSAGNSVQSFREDSLFSNSTFTAPDAGTFVMSPCIENDTVMYIGNMNGKVYSVNTRTNAVKWTYTTGASISSTLITIGGNVLFGSADKNFYSIDTETGLKRWHIATGDKITGAPYVDRQNVYFGGFDKNIYCIDIIDGEIVWQVPTVGLVKGSPIVHQGKLYIAGYDQIMYCLNSENGQQYWVKNIGGLVEGAPMLDNLNATTVSALDGAYSLK